MFKLYVGNLDYGVTDQELGELFSQFGEVATSMIIMDRETGRSRGFGFVEMRNADDMQKAIDKLHGQELSGRQLVVNKAKPKEHRDSRDRTQRPSY